MKRNQLHSAPTQSNFCVFCLLVIKTIDNKIDIIEGTNGEQGYIGGAICAERAALLQLRLLKNPTILKVVVTTDSNNPISPGMLCREYLMSSAEPDTLVIMGNNSGDNINTSTLAELYPFPYVYRHIIRQNIMTFANDYSTKIEFLSEHSNEIIGSLHKKTLDCIRYDKFDILHPVRFSAGVFFSNGDISVAWQLKGLEFGCTLDPITQLLREIEYRNISNSDDIIFECNKPVYLLMIDQFGVAHAPFAQARALLSEHGYGDIITIVHDEDGKLHNVKISDLAPAVELDYLSNNHAAQAKGSNNNNEIKSSEVKDSDDEADNDDETNSRHRSRPDYDEDTSNDIKNKTINKRVYETSTPINSIDRNKINNYNKRSRGQWEDRYINHQPNYPSFFHNQPRAPLRPNYNNVYEPTYPHFSEIPQWYPPFTGFPPDMYIPPVLGPMPIHSPLAGPLPPPIIPPIPNDTLNYPAHYGSNHPPPTDFHWNNHRMGQFEGNRHYQHPNPDAVQMTPSMGYLKPQPPRGSPPEKGINEVNESIDTTKPIHSITKPYHKFNKFKKYQYVNNVTDLLQVDVDKQADNSTDSNINNNRNQIKSPIWKKKGWNQYSLAKHKQSNSDVNESSTSKVEQKLISTEIDAVDSLINLNDNNIDHTADDNNDGVLNDNNIGNSPNDSISSNINQSVSTTTKKPSYSQIVQSKQVKEENLIVQQKYEGLKLLRYKQDEIRRKKENLILEQTNKIHEMIKELEKSKESTEKQKLLNNFETKLIDLQSQLQDLKEQKTKESSNQNVSLDNKSSGRGFAYRGAGRFSRAYVEALHYVVVAVEKWDMKTLAKDYPRAYRAYQYVDTPEKVKKFLVGRQFFTIFVVFLISDITSFPNMPANFAGMPSILVTILVKTGLPGVALVLTFGQLVGQIYVEEYTLPFLNFYGTQFCIRLSLFAEWIGICNFSWLLFHIDSRVLCRKVRRMQRTIDSKKHLTNDNLVALAAESTKSDMTIDGEPLSPTELNRGPDFDNGIPDEKLTLFDYVKYLWSSAATIGSVIVVCIGIIKRTYVLPVPEVAAFIIAICALTMLFFLEGLMIAIVATQYWDPETFREHYPRAYAFCTVLTNFLLAQIFTFASYNNPGLVGVLLTLAFAQLQSELLAAEYPLRFLNMVPCYYIVWISLIFDALGVGHCAWAVYYSTHNLCCKSLTNAGIHDKLDSSKDKPKIVRVTSAEILALTLPPELQASSKV
eukprot:gene19885-25840_t